MDVERITQVIIGCAFRVHNELGTGFLEKVYENAPKLEIEEAGLPVVQQAPIAVRYRNRVVGDYYADLLVADRVIVEIKAVQQLAKEHEAQLVHYLYH